MLSTFSADLKLIIPGIHDNSLGEKASQRSPEMEQAHKKAVKLRTGRKAIEPCIVYLTEGLHKFTLKSGATFSAYAPPYTPELNDWAFGYPRHFDRFGPASVNQNPITGMLNIVMNHGHPFGHLEVLMLRLTSSA